MAQKLKYDGRWVNAEDLPALREADRPPPTPAPPLDFATLPERKDLDPDVPLQQLFFERPEVRAYITKDGQIRSGLKPSERAVAEEIFKRYGGQA